MQNDEIKITILADGQIKIETDGIGQGNHTSADKLLATMARLAGGESETVRKPQAHTHSHHGVSHTH